MDKFGFKKLMIVITIIEIVVGSSIYFIVKFKTIYAFSLLLVSSCIGGSFVILATIFIKVFSLYIGPELYGITGISIGIANIMGPLLILLLSGKNYSFLIIFLIGVVFCIIKLIIVILFNENEKIYQVKKDSVQMNIINDSSTDDGNEIDYFN